MLFCTRLSNSFLNFLLSQNLHCIVGEHVAQTGPESSTGNQISKPLACMRKKQTPQHMAAEKAKLSKKDKRKTYNSRDSHVVTHHTTNLPACGLSTAERTGSPVLHTLWSYVLDNDQNRIKPPRQCTPANTKTGCGTKGSNR